jgi:hypothetical protein
LWSQRLQKTREAIMALVTRSALPQPPPAPEPSPQPIAVIAAGLPIEEVITQLTAAQASHPGAKVRRGKRNRWEIGPE